MYDIIFISGKEVSMAIKTVFFDLDGTLLPMDQDAFVRAYTKSLAAYMAPYGYDPKALVQSLWEGTGAMVKNDGKRANEEVFWEVFSAGVGKDARADEPTFALFYDTDFQKAKGACGFAPEAARAVRRLKERGFRVVLATNPLFPHMATENRIRWAGLEVEDFDFYTTYENSSCCKPNLAYYQEILDKLGSRAEECAMVGNDVDEDMVAAKLGFKTFLLTPCLINRSGQDISQWPHGGFAELAAWLETL